MDLALVWGCVAGGATIGAATESLAGRLVAAQGEAGTLDPARSVEGAHLAALSLQGAPRPTTSERRICVAASTVVTATLFLLAAVRLGSVPHLAAYCALLAGLVAVSIADLRLGIIPRIMLYPAFGLCLAGLVGASWAEGRWFSLVWAVAGGAIAFGVFFALWWFFPNGIGYGDVRLAGVLGASLGWLGPGELYVGFLAAFLLGTAFGAAVMVVRRSGRGTRFAFGPSLAAGAAFSVLWGGWIIQLWRGHA
ncbi:MAG: prepilin peptidase [Acidimicrobiales bacterium]